jgi:hypothetical protein
LFAAALSIRGAPLPSEWQRQQQFNVPTAGLFKLTLPIETLDASRPGLEDLRLYDDAGNEVPYALEHPTAASKTVQSARSFELSLQANATVITIETGLAQPLDAVTLDTPATDFIKAVRVEGSKNKRNWEVVAEGLPVFRQSNGLSQLRLAVPEGVWLFLRLTIEDRRSSPVPFTGARVHAAFTEPTPSEPLTVNILERHEDPGETRLRVNLGAANLTLANIHIETPEPLFTRRVTVSVPEIAGDTISERAVSNAVLYRMATDGQAVSSNLSVPLEMLIRSRELFLVVENQDSPPLLISAVRAERRPVNLVFMARQPGVHHLLTGNPQCPAPRYDLASPRTNLKGASLLQSVPTELTSNPSYRPPEALPGIQESGTALDVAPWTFRKSVELADATVQELELDLDVLAHAQPGFHDLRLVREGKQIPYILERTSLTRTMSPVVAPANDPKKPKHSRWAIKLTHPGLPLARVTCASPTSLFQREVVLYEEPRDNRGQKYERALNRMTWVRTPDRATKEFALSLSSPPETDTVFLEIDNGDNPPIELGELKVFYPVARALFKARPGESVFLYYGNRRADAPRYDLTLVAGQVLSAIKGKASLGREEQLKSSWRDARGTGKGGPFFWGILSLVVVVLLFVISRLLPKQSAPGA